MQNSASLILETITLIYFFHRFHSFTQLVFHLFRVDSIHTLVFHGATRFSKFLPQFFPQIKFLYVVLSMIVSLNFLFSTGNYYGY